MPPKKSTKKRSTIKTKKNKHVSLLLPRHMFDTDRAQLVVSLLMLTILIIQVYLFINVYQLLGQIAEMTTT